MFDSVLIKKDPLNGGRKLDFGTLGQAFNFVVSEVEHVECWGEHDTLQAGNAIQGW